MDRLHQTSTASDDDDDTSDPLRQGKNMIAMRNTRQMAILNTADFLKCL